VTDPCAVPGCTRRRRHDLLVATCLRHVTAETWDTLAAMVGYRGPRPRHLRGAA
jgi:hypothetical protein